MSPLFDLVIVPSTIELFKQMQSSHIQLLIVFTIIAGLSLVKL